MPRNISGADPLHSDGVFSQILVNTFAAQINSSATGFLVYNSVSTSPLFKIVGSGASPYATFYCDLNVIGSATFTSVANIAVTSSMMSLATGNTVSDLIDIGFYGLYTSSGAKYRGLVYSISLGRWILFKDITTVPGTTITLSGSYRDTLEVQDIYYNGDGSTLSALKTLVGLFPTELQNLTTAEIQQLENIGANTISATQWGYISNSNQRTDTAGTPSFSGLTLSTGVASLPAGVIGTPSLNWGDAATGIYRTGTNQIGIAANGSLITFWSTTGLSMNTGAIAALTGSVGTPAINLSDTTTGLYRPGANQIGIAVSGANVGTWSSTGLAMNTLAISGVSTLTATTLSGTLSTATQNSVTTMTGLATINSVGNTVTISGAALTSTILNSYLATMNQALTTTSSPTFGTVTASLTGHSSLDLALTGGTMSGVLNMGGFNISGGGTITATTFSGSLTGHSSLDLALTGGTMSGSIAMGGFNISGGGTITATTFSGSLTGHSSLDLALTGGTMSGSIAMGTFNISNAGTITATTFSGSLTGTLNTASQPNITTLANISSIGTSSAISIDGKSITQTQFGYLSNTDQNIATTSSPTFATQTLTNQLLMAAGSVSAPSFAWSAETNSGYYRSAANNISMAIGGSLIATWLAGGLYMNGTSINNIGDLSAVNSYNSGKLTAGTVSGSANVRLSVYNATTDLAGVYITNPISATGTSLYGLLMAPTYQTSSNSYFAADIYSQSTFNSTNNMLAAYGAYFSHTVSNSGTISNYYGVYSGGMSAASATITNAYSGYFGAPSSGTNKFALYATNLSVGASTAPPTNGIYSSGQIQAANGSASTTAFGFGSSANTGIYYSSNALNFSVSGTKRAHFDNVGNLFLDVEGGAIQTTGTSSGSMVGHWFMANSGTNKWGVGLSGSSNDLGIFGYRSSDSAYFDAMTFYRTTGSTAVQTQVTTIIGSSAALATTATAGFLYIPTCAGPPTGVPTAYTGKVAQVYDTTNNKLYCYNGAWKGVTLA